MKFWAMDSWEQDYIQLNFDNINFIDLFDLYWKDYELLPNICGGKEAEVKDILIFGSVPHFGNSLILKIISKLNAKTNDGSFGVREIKLIFSTTPKFAPLCAIIPVQSYKIPNCRCPKGSYDLGFPKTTCNECHPNCASCFGGSDADCYECNEGNYFDGTGCANCHSLCSRCLGPNSNQCLDCFAGFILFEGECVPSECCIFPFTMVNCSNSCLSPCDYSDKTLWDENCYPHCQPEPDTVSDSKDFCHGKFCFV